VILNIKDEDGVWNNFKNMTRSIKEKMPDVKIEGVTIQPMVNMKDATEMILGIKKDPVFGTVLLVGMVVWVQRYSRIQSWLFRL